MDWATGGALFWVRGRFERTKPFLFQYNSIDYGGRGFLLRKIQNPESDIDSSE
ncbi:hypothetical protein BYT27DRAFT_7251119 [Phlegmacium glaucopus]|nr:hypothetical protein BYT27DRAFT_7251119 [Phlegmacium glaucopus]